MRENFDRAFLLVIGAEGKPTNDPDDPGGFTIWGLAKHYHPEIDTNTPIDYAKQVYRKEYWDAIGADDLPSPLDIAAFDFAVTSAPGDAIALLKVTRHWEEFMIRRIKHYSEVVRKKPKMAKYFRGWVNRVINLWLEIQPH